METLQLKLVSDGTPQRTFLTTLDGKKILGVYCIRWELDARNGKLAKLTVELDLDTYKMPLEVMGELADYKLVSLKEEATA